MTREIKLRRPSLLALLLAVLVTLAGCAKFQERRSAESRVPPASAKANFIIAVGDFTSMVMPVGLPVGTSLGHEAADMVTDALIKDEHYQIVSADDVRQLLNDAPVSAKQGNVTDPPAIMKRISTQLGARVLVTGTVLLQEAESSALAARAPAGHRTTGKVIRLEAEFVSTQDGSVLAHVVAASRPSATDLEGQSLEQALHEAAAALTREITRQAEQLNTQMNAAPPPGGSSANLPLTARR